MEDGLSSTFRCASSPLRPLFLAWAHPGIDVSVPWAPGCWQLPVCVHYLPPHRKGELAGRATKMWNKSALCKPDSLVVVQLLSCVHLFGAPWTAARLLSLSFTVSPSLLKFTSIESVMPSNHPILCHPLLLLPSIFPSTRVCSSQDSLESCSTFSLEYLEAQHSMAFFISNSVGKDGLFCLWELGFQVMKIPCKQNVVLEFCSFSTLKNILIFIRIEFLYSVDSFCCAGNWISHMCTHTPSSSDFLPI